MAILQLLLILAPLPSGWAIIHYFHWHGLAAVLCWVGSFLLIVGLIHFFSRNIKIDEPE